MSPSSFAGNPFFLDLEELTREGLLTQKELDAARRADPDRVDYAWLHQTRIPLLRRAWERGRVCYAQPLAEFMVEEADWLPDYALFLALRERFGGKELKDWPDEIRLRHPSALARYRAAGGRVRLPRLPPAPVLPPVDRRKSLRQWQGDLHHRRSAHLRLP